MSKLPNEHQFLDLSDYGRPMARWIAKTLINTSFTPIHITITFIISGLVGVYFILEGYYLLAAVFLILKSILDAADGELARVKNTPSYTGRYLDSVADILLNAVIFLSLWHITDTSAWITFFAFLGLQLQGTLYNYYYVILRNQWNGDTTSRVFENETPIALKGEKQRHVDILFSMYKILYGGFDKAIYALDPKASKAVSFPNWFMTAVSTFGLGFQLLLIAILLVAGLKDIILPFFLIYSVMVFVFVVIRRFVFK